MRILFLHGWQSIPGGVKPTFLAQHGHTVLNPVLSEDDFDAALAVAQAEFDKHQPNVIVGSSRGGALAMNLEAGETPLVLLCPAWKKYGTAKTIRANSTILHSRADDVIPYADSEELVRNSGLPVYTLVETGSDHRLADQESLEIMLHVSKKLSLSCEDAMPDNANRVKPGFDIYEHYRTLTNQLIARCSILGTIFDHGTLKGNTAEKIMRDLLKKFFPTHIRVETGQIVSPNGVRSPQTDVIVFSDVPGSVIGIDEDGVCLIRHDAVRCVVEIKKSMIFTTVDEFQRHSKRLAESMVSGKRKSSWVHWTIAITSAITSERILDRLKETCDFSCSTGGLLVLDAPLTPVEFETMLGKCGLTFAEVDGEKQLHVKEKQLIDLSIALKEPNSFFVIRNRHTKYQIEGDRTDALLRFMIKLEETTLQSESCGPMWLRDFAVAQMPPDDSVSDSPEE